MNALIFSIFNGTLYGLLLFMISSGLTLIFSMMGVLNLAHSSLFMLGAYFAFTISKYVGFWPALIFAPLGVGVIGALIERYGLRAVHKYGHVAELLFTFGLFYVFEDLVQMVHGKLPNSPTGKAVGLNENELLVASLIGFKGFGRDFFARYFESAFGFRLFETAPRVDGDRHRNAAGIPRRCIGEQLLAERLVPLRDHGRAGRPGKCGVIDELDLPPDLVLRQLQR